MNESGAKTPGVCHRLGDTYPVEKIAKQRRKKQQSDDGVKPEEDLLIAGFFGEQTPERME